MATSERHNQIISVLDQYKKISVEDLAKLVYASPATIRRDLQVLEQQGLLKRVRGGAVSVQGDHFDLPVYLRTSSEREEKEYIAQLALRFIGNSSTYFFDSSSTCCFLAQKLSGYSGLTVATTGLEILSILKGFAGVRLISFGGEVRKNYDEFTGPMTMANIAQFYADTLFMSCRGLSFQAGATETHGTNAAIKQQMIKHSKRCILLCDHTKFDQDFFYKAADLQDIDYVITDRKPQDHKLVHALKDKLIYQREL